MKKQPKPNLHFILKSAISALQVTYKDYKTAIIEDLRCSWYSDNGEFTFLDGAEERKKKIEDLGQEVIRLKAKVDEIKNEIEADKEYEAEVITRGNCMICGKKLDEDEDLFFCKECEAKAEKEEA